jgi:hypothetical protein
MLREETAVSLLRPIMRNRGMAIESRLEDQVLKPPGAPAGDLRQKDVSHRHLSKHFYSMYGRSELWVG